MYFSLNFRARARWMVVRAHFHPSNGPLPVKDHRHQLMKI
jgi:hypothetical protein